MAAVPQLISALQKWTFVEAAEGPDRTVSFVDRTYIHMSSSAKSLSAERNLYTLYDQPELPPICSLVDEPDANGIIKGSWWSLAPAGGVTRG